MRDVLYFNEMNLSGVYAVRFLSAVVVSLVTVSSVPSLAQAEALQRRSTGAYMNSLYDLVPPMMKLLVEANGEQFFAAQGSYDITPPVAPPNWNQNWIRFGVPSPGVTQSWPSVERANVTDVIIVTDNFSGPPVYGSQGANPNPAVAGPIPRPPVEGKALTWGDEVTDIIAAHEENVTDEPIYWIYEGWADGGKILDDSTGAGSDRDFARWRERTTSQYDYTGWFDNLLEHAKKTEPSVASRIRMIPVARTMVSVMENTPASDIKAGEWFKDAAPHGNDTLHLLVAMIVYSTMFEQKAPKPDVSTKNIHSVFMDNYEEISDHVFEAVQPYIPS
ncbi:hypothetical protein CLV75_2453 [Ruegeria conchae]|uniref:Uncharacterized protein n=1 Tax=Ruegeria conchae TaxID=981384 RepID=A0A497ZHR0_9RHOB|nr:hypothetical protein CLV75_2453 [Ruegeria conchae]